MDNINANLQFLKDGKTTREDVLLKLGEPSGQFEGERILTYILLTDNEGKLHVLPRQVPMYPHDPRMYVLNSDICSLVLVFGSDNILMKHSLIGTKEEVK
jgi:hypothetical protein